METRTAHATELRFGNVRRSAFRAVHETSLLSIHYHEKYGDQAAIVQMIRAGASDGQRRVNLTAK